MMYVVVVFGSEERTDDDVDPVVYGPFTTPEAAQAACDAIAPEYAQMGVNVDWFPVEQPKGGA